MRIFGVWINQHFPTLNTHVSKDFDKCPFSWINNELSVNFKNTCRNRKRHINIDDRTKFQFHRIIISHFVVHWVILLFMSARYGHPLIIDDLLVKNWFLKTEMVVKTIMKIPWNFCPICLTPSYQIWQKLFVVLLFDPSKFENLSPQVLRNFDRERVYWPQSTFFKMQEKRKLSKNERIIQMKINPIPNDLFCQLIQHDMTGGHMAPKP